MGRLPLSQFKFLGHGIRSHVLRLLSVHYPDIGLGVPVIKLVPGITTMASSGTSRISVSVDV